MHNLWIPVVAIFAVAGLIFGHQAYSEAQRDAHISEAISERLGSQATAEIAHLVSVNKGYGVCGDYTLSGFEPGRFYYNSATERLAVGSDEALYRDNCARVSN
ncbi:MULTISPECIES: hypothetical protein [unclassified Halomonas]|uniref:hypothetical protein n=1 Tax=unclassified Halomonas TaxID=2609666 RepID=UPI00209DCDBE|nr:MULTISPECIES: hypothetical protein [unclassified Halomonas]MCP1316162.1 hypothetical protein [Halomonas sp. 707D7]MCP1328656.1 hypothetical protein [Halomonas sp. 707D4]